MTPSEDRIKIIARIRSDFPSKFGIPRQSGIADSLISEIVFEPEYRNDAALRGIEGFSHLWLIWKFSESVRADNTESQVKTDGNKSSGATDWSPTVRPPRLGGNKRVGVFATRSPFRPNPIGLSSVRLVGVNKGKEGTVLKVSGADLMDGTPIYDIKPYLSYTDSHPDACDGFAAARVNDRLDVRATDEMLSRIAPEKREGLITVLSQNPVPHYISDPNREYGFVFAGNEIRFKTDGTVLTVTDIFPVRR